MTMKHIAKNTDLGTFTLYHHGAHLTQWQTKGEEQLFMSTAAEFAPGKPIRGGVPVIFPQFAALGDGARHGFARNLEWQLVNEAEHAVTLKLESSETSKAHWPHDFTLLFTATLEPHALHMQLDVMNTGSDTFDFSAALHTYFAVDQAKGCEIEGLKGCSHWDNGTPFTERNTDSGQRLTITGPIDRLYFDTPGRVSLIEKNRTRIIQQEGFTDVVVWNPWEEGAAGIHDLENEEYRNMLCIEAVKAGTPVQLAPGAQWSGVQRITVAD